MPDVTSTYVREAILRQSHRAHVGHIGSSLSIADIIATLYGSILRIDTPLDPDRDRFVLSKGHAVLAVYAALNQMGRMSDSIFDSFCCDGTVVGMHPETALSGIDFCTGSLGQGLSFGAGAALAAKLQGSERKVYVLLSDAEMNEGSVWEAALFAAHHKLSNLVAIIDANGQQALGKTRDVMNTEPLLDKWRAFGWDAGEVDGHNVEEMTCILRTLDSCKPRPTVLVARTTFGKGVSFMEGQIKWHYWPMNDEEFNTAVGHIRP